MDSFLLSRELGDSQTLSTLELEYTTRLTHSIQEAPGRIFRGEHDPGGITALDIEKQESRYMLSAGHDASISIWDLDSATPVSGEECVLKPVASIPSAKSHKFGITAISFYPPDHGLFITSSHDKLVRVWDTTLLTPAHTFKLRAPVYAAVMAPKSFHTLIATSSQSSDIRLLDLNTGASTHSLIGHTGGFTLGLAWSPRDEYILASGGVDSAVRLWDIRRATGCLAILDKDNEGRAKNDVKNISHKGAVNGVAWSEDGAVLVTIGADNEIRGWDMATGRNTLTISHPLLRSRTEDFLFGLPPVVTPILTPLRMSDPQLVFIPAGDKILGFHLNDGCLAKPLKPIEAKRISALTHRPHRPELYSSAWKGNITAWIPETPEHEEGEVASLSGNQDVLNKIYRNLIQTPITFT